MNIRCRKAVEADVDYLEHMIQGYADKGIMLPRSRAMLLEQLDDFVVAVDTEAEAGGAAAGDEVRPGERLIGCGSLCKLGDDLVEIRSLGVSEDYQGQGVGRLIVDKLVAEAKERRIQRVFALTYAVPFFERNGFEVVPKEIFPEKVWKDCIHCKKQDNCDEIAVLKRLEVDGIA